MWDMRSLMDILGDKDFDVPVEVTEIKAYIKRHFDKEVGVGLQKTVIIITCSSAALAGSIRPHLHKLQKQLKTEKKLIVRIG
jgi:hypothetical protein